MEIHRIAISLLLAAGLCAGGTARAQDSNSQEPPPFPGHDEQPAADNAAPVTEAATNDPGGQSLDYFHEQLSPYGQWVAHERYGEVWVPQVPAGWRPYTSGHWGYTDQGWGWIANEPWGWATFHYGRWFYDPSLNWAWVPGNEWAPAWVAWRHGDGYVGWAPLPPNIEFSVEGGLGLGAAEITPGFFTFVTEKNLLASDASTVILSSTRNGMILPRTVDLTRYAVSGSRVVNPGVDVHRIEQVTGRPVPRLHVEAMGSRPGGERGAFYQPPVVTRAAHTTHAEFGKALDSRAVAQRRSHLQGPSSGVPSAQRGRGPEPRPSSGFGTPDRGTTQRPASSSDANRSHTYTQPERQPQQSQPTPAPTKAQPKRQEGPQPTTQARPQTQPKAQEKPQQKSDDKSKHKPPL